MLRSTVTREFLAYKLRLCTYTYLHALCVCIYSVDGLCSLSTEFCLSYSSLQNDSKSELDLILHLTGGF